MRKSTHSKLNYLSLSVSYCCCCCCCCRLLLLHFFSLVFFCCSLLELPAGPKRNSNGRIKATGSNVYTTLREGEGGGILGSFSSFLAPGRNNFSMRTWNAELEEETSRKITTTASLDEWTLDWLVEMSSIAFETQKMRKQINQILFSRAQLTKQQLKN